MVRALIACVVVLAVAAAGHAQTELVHKPAYKEGDVIRTVTEVTTDQTLTLAGQNVETAVENHSATRETIGATTDGKTTMTGEFEFFTIGLDTPLGRYMFDSGNANAETSIEPLKELDALFRALTKSKWTSVVSDKPEVVSFEFAGDPFSQLSDAVKGEMKPERFMRDTNIQLARLPGMAVAVGDKWTRTEESQIGSGQTLTLEREFEYLGEEQKDGRTFDKIGMTALSVKYALGAGSAIPLKLDSADLKIESSEGSLLYDRELGVVTKTSDVVRITGPINFAITANGQEQKLPGELDLTMTSSSTVEPPQQ